MIHLLGIKIAKSVKYGTFKIHLFWMNMKNISDHMPLEADHKLQENNHGYFEREPTLQESNPIDQEVGLVNLEDHRVLQDNLLEHLDDETLDFDNDLAHLIDDTMCLGDVYPFSDKESWHLDPEQARQETKLRDKLQLIIRLETGQGDQ